MTTTFEQALANCSKEPIHIPGAIQPFGVLLAFDEELRITHCSENVTALGRDPGAALGASIEELIGCDVRPLIRAGDFESSQPFRPGGPLAAGDWEASLHRHRGQLILELEAVPAGGDLETDAAFGGSVRIALATMESSMSVPALCQRACEQVRQLTGLDGLMVYKFHDDGHGEVIAESKGEEWPKYLGLHYPASDIPPQARAIFLDNWVRMIPERDYTPVRLVSHDASAPPLDLGRSLLRSVSPVHIEYLRNMGVCASLTLSLISEGRLWGLIAGHHYRGPRHIGSGKRAAAELVARLVSQQLAHREDLEIAGVRKSGTEVLQELVRKMQASTELADGLVQRPQDVRDLLGCGGAAVALPDGGWRKIGKTPSREQLVQLAAWLDQRGGDWRIFH